jgi:hypothetical protein
MQVGGETEATRSTAGTWRTNTQSILFGTEFNLNRTEHQFEQDDDNTFNLIDSLYFQ